MVHVFLIFYFLFSVLWGAERWDSFAHFPPTSTVYHPVTTQSKEAQELFNLGLLGLYAFNHDQAFRYFEQAAHADSFLAMAYWGMALALGENINRPITHENAQRAYRLIQIALQLSERTNITASERSYIAAAAKRYSENSSADQNVFRRAYAHAMQTHVLNFPDDLDAKTLFAESLMDLRPWDLWTFDGKPQPGTEEIVQVLESVLKTDPHHLGANHYYIHAIEASPHPERALMSAIRLNKLLPEWGHILHMPSHIYFLVGDYKAAQEANERAVFADKQYIEKYGLTGFYPLHYLSHNLYFLCRSALWQEQFKNAYDAARALQNFLQPHISHMPELEYYLLAPLQVLLYFHKWEEILEMSEPRGDLKGWQAFWHYARSLAFITLGDLKNALIEKELFYTYKMHVSTKEKLGFNRAEQVLFIAENLLKAAFAKANKDTLKQINYLKQAIATQDVLHYNEPPDWYYPIRQTLGASYLELEDPASAENAFEDALKKWPRNGRSLYGLLESLKKQNKETYWVERETKAALQNADTPLNIKYF